ncbi:hypothetical protein [Pseudomonas fluorescens]|uniref:hypothetical protein n=1 Tax=Pseudomonas fluorescens TaxID=294 RepID=UPI0017826490|nr:hypothetical protein [Pseudomonas fluorescens]
MHIEITYCQGNIPISEIDTARRKSAQQKKAAIPMILQKIRVEILIRAEGSCIARLVSVLEYHSRRLPSTSSEVEGKYPSCCQRKQDD